jgi:hypothetical protein
MSFRKPAEWIKRYGPAEVAAIAGAVTGGLLLHIFTGNPLATAIGATWGENIAYYGFIVAADIRGRDRREYAKVARNIFIEFGPAEVLDSFLVRPAAMYLFPRLLNNVAIGLIVGKLAADFIFYIPTILGYEFRKKFFNN